MKKLGWLYTLILIFFASTPIISQVLYNVRGQDKVLLVYPAPAFIGKPTFTLEDLTYALANTPCGNCPDKLTVDTLIIAYKKVIPSNKGRILPSLQYYASLADKGYCPGLPSTGQLKMVLHLP